MNLRETSTIASPSCAPLLHTSLPAESTPWTAAIIKNKRWMLSTREWLTFLPTNTSRKWLATPLRHDATLTKSRSDVSRPTDAFCNIVDAKLLSRVTLHRLFRCAPTSWLPTRSPRAAPMFLVLRTRFATSAWGGRYVLQHRRCQVARPCVSPSPISRGGDCLLA
jgi:hypothetical protein